MKTIYFVRHGETEGNTGKVFQGPDTPLTEKGEEQARTVAHRCKKLLVECLISSTMLRAQETARIIAAQIGKSVELSDLFNERRRPSILFDKPAEDPDVKHIEKDWRDSFITDGRKVFDADDFFEVRSRAARALAFLESREEKHILIVTHGFYLQMLLAYIISSDALTPAEFKDISNTFETNNTGITVFQFDQKIPHPWFVRVWNDHAHLG